VVQQNSLREDLPETARRLKEFLPFERGHLKRVAKVVQELDCELVLCDIAPMGIAVAEAVGIPSILVENFTWDWIYEGYVTDEARMGDYLGYLAALFETATYHIQTEPVCAPQPVDLTTAPVSRKPRTSPQQIRAALGVPASAQLVMVTMGGGTWDYTFARQLEAQTDCYFIVAGNGKHLERHKNVIILPRRSPFFHPDLVNACQAVIGKVGYSTIAEVYQAGVPFGYIARARFRESPQLIAFIEAHLPVLPISQEQFMSGAWLTQLPTLLALPRLERVPVNGADEIAAFVGRILAKK
jgi:hypothetical protein